MEKSTARSTIGHRRTIEHSTRNEQNRAKKYTDFFYCNRQVYRDFLITLYLSHNKYKYDAFFLKSHDSLI
jgi:hypothetical protein